MSTRYGVPQPKPYPQLPSRLVQTVLTTPAASATATPATVVAIAAIPAPNVIANATTTPSAVVAVGAVPTSVGTSLLVQQDTSDNSDNLFGGSGTNEELAQAFQLANPTTVFEVDLYLVTANSPVDNVTLDIVSSLDGSSLASATVSALSISSS